MIWKPKKTPSSLLLLSKNGPGFKTNCVITSSRRWKAVWSATKSCQRARRLKTKGTVREALSEGYGKRSSTSADKAVQLRWIGIWQNVYLRCKYASQQRAGDVTGRRRRQQITAFNSLSQSNEIIKNVEFPPGMRVTFLCGDVGHLCWRGEQTSCYFGDFDFFFFFCCSVKKTKKTKCVKRFTPEATSRWQRK